MSVYVGFAPADNTDTNIALAQALQELRNGSTRPANGLEKTIEIVNKNVTSGTETVVGYIEATSLDTTVLALETQLGALLTQGEALAKAAGQPITTAA